MSLKKNTKCVLYEYNFVIIFSLVHVYFAAKYFKIFYFLFPQVTEDVPVDTSKYSDVLIKLNGCDPSVLTSFYRYVDQAARNMKFDVTKKYVKFTLGWA